LACALARDYGARLVLLHVAVPPEVVREAVLVPILRDNQAELAEKLHQLAVSHANLHVEHRLERGDAATEILRVAQEDRTDLIVIGTHGRTGLGRLLKGSVAEQVVRKAPCPVLTVKVPPSSGPPAEESGKAPEDSVRGAFTTPQV
jgi:nucleotide-binding universal stress UspA family protein